MRTRTHDWFDVKKLKPRYSFQIHVNGRWHNVAEDGKPCIFATTAERDAKRAEYRRMPEALINQKKPVSQVA